MNYGKTIWQYEVNVDVETEMILHTNPDQIWGKFLTGFKVIYTKYSKHLSDTVAHTIECVCIKC